MPQLLNVQQFKMPGGLPFLLPEQAQWVPKVEGAQTHKVRASASSMALRGLQDVIRIWQQVGTSTILAQYQIRSLEQLYIFRRPEEVFWFLHAHPFLIPLLFEAHAHIARRFGPYPLVFLEVVTDPESIDDRQLVAFIRMDLDPIEALASLDRFDKGWWLEASHRSRGKLCIHLE
jgi:hypothetical protein